MSEADKEGRHVNVQAAEGDHALDEAQRRAIASKMKAAAFGEIVALYMRSPSHRGMTLAQLEALLLPPMSNKQYVVAKAKPKDDPDAVGALAGVVIWAFVSDDIDRRLSQETGEEVALKPEDWRGGDRAWIVDVVASPQVAAALVEELKRSTFAGRPFKARIKGADGRVAVKTFQGADKAA